LVIITRNDIPPGYQLVQATHSIADFAYEHPKLFNDWKSDSNSIVTLQIPNEAELDNLITLLYNNDAHLSIFREPDIGNQITSICVYGTSNIRKKLASLPLSLKQYNKQLK